LKVLCAMATRALSVTDALLLVVLIVFWGSSFVVVKMVLGQGLTPVSIATYRFLLAGGLFVLALVFRRRRKSESKMLIEMRDLPVFVFLALSGVTFFFLAQYTGINMAGASIAAIFACFLSPIFIAVGSVGILKEHVSKWQVLGIGFAAFGTLIVILGGSVGLQFDPNFFYGSIILLATPFLWTFYTLLGKRAVEKYNPILVLTYVTVLGGAFLLPFSLAENSILLALSMSVSSWLAIAYLSITCTLLGYYIWFYSVEKVGATVTSAILFAEPLVTVLLAAAFVGEKVTAPIAVGGVLIFVGVYLVTKKVSARTFRST
jgi:drug/metabolite transporter (DMT)-like permease